MRAEVFLSKRLDGSAIVRAMSISATVKLSESSLVMEEASVSQDLSRVQIAPPTLVIVIMFSRLSKLASICCEFAIKRMSALISRISVSSIWLRAEPDECGATGEILRILCNPALVGKYIEHLDVVSTCGMLSLWKIASSPWPSEQISAMTRLGFEKCKMEMYCTRCQLGHLLNLYIKQPEKEIRRLTKESLSKRSPSEDCK